MLWTPSRPHLWIPMPRPAYMMADRARMAAAGRGGTAYRYFRINITDNNGDAYTGIGDLRYIDAAAAEYPTDMTSDSAPSPLVASADSYTAGDDPYRAFSEPSDNRNWQKSGTSGWLKVDLGSGNEVVITSAKMKVTFSGGDLARAPKDWTFEGSNNDSDWDVLNTQSGITSWSTGVYKTFTF